MLKPITIDISTIQVDGVPAPADLMATNAFFEVDDMGELGYLDWCKKKIFTEYSASERSSFIMKQIREQFGKTLLSLLEQNGYDFNEKSADEEPKPRVVLDFTQIKDKSNDRRLYLPWELMRTKSGESVFRNLQLIRCVKQPAKEKNSQLKKLRVLLVDSRPRSRDLIESIENIIGAKVTEDKLTDRFSVGKTMEVTIIGPKADDRFVTETRLKINESDVVIFIGPVSESNKEFSFELALNKKISIDRTTYGLVALKNIILIGSAKHNLSNFRNYEQALVRLIELGIPTASFIPFCENIPPDKILEEYFRYFSENADRITTFRPAESVSNISTTLFLYGQAEFFPVAYQNSTETVEFLMPTDDDNADKIGKTNKTGGQSRIDPSEESRDIKKDLQDAILDLQVAIEGHRDNKENSTFRKNLLVLRPKILKALQELRPLDPKAVKDFVKTLMSKDREGREDFWNSFRTDD